jgi:putative peptide zinc metalloprotease protein
MSLEEASGRTFSDSWHRVATVRVCLRGSVSAHRQSFQGQGWVILHDRLSSDWYRISPDAYHFLSRLDGQQTVEEVWEASISADPERALTQEEVVQLLGQLNLSNLLQYDAQPSDDSLFDRLIKRKSKERKALMMGFLSIKIPLIDPDRFLNRSLPAIRLIFSRWGLVAYLALLLWGGKALIDASDRLFDQSAGLLAPSNLGLLYLGFLVSKALHEISHAAVCKRFGGEVHTLGVMLLIFAPMPYVDASATWGFRSRTERVMVGLAGVAAELALAAVAAVLWANTAPGTFNSLAYNVIFVASVSTLVFNLNPLLRFDGYHMLVDLIEMPNLFQRSRDQLKYLGERYLLRLPQAQPVARTPREGVLLPLYGVASIVYWLLLMSTIVFFIAEEYLDLGVALAILLVVFSFVVPLGKFLKYLATGPTLADHRAQAVFSTVAIIAVVMGFLSLVPLPDRVRVTGVVQAQASQQVHTGTEGFLVELLARPGSTVEAGQPLARLSNPSLDFEIRSVEMQLSALVAQEIRAVATAVADLAAISKQRTAVEESLHDLHQRRDALILRAPLSGTWAAPQLIDAQGQWFARGSALGTVAQLGEWKFIAVLPQVASHVFKEEIQQAEVRLVGQEQHNLFTEPARVMPFEQGALPSAALGMAGGGLIAVSPSDPQGLVAAEPFFRIEAAFGPGSQGLTDRAVRLSHGQIGTMRLTLSSRPLLAQWTRDVRQFLQRRFRV